MGFIDLDSLNAKEIMEGFQGKFVHGKTMTTSFWKVKAGSILPRHSHFHEQISVISSGKFEITIGEETKVLEPGMVGVIPPNVEHEGKAITDCMILDVFCPVREDYSSE